MRNAVLTVIVAIVFVGVMAGVVAGIIRIQQTPPPAPAIDPQVAPTTAAQQPAPAVPQAEPSPQPMVAIQRIALDGQDVADLQGLMMWKYRFYLPQGQYTAHIWAEYWTRESTTPELRELFTTSGEWDGGDIVIKVPTEEDERMFARIGPTSMTRAASAEPLGVPSGALMQVLERSPLLPDQDMILAAFTYNQFESGVGGLTSSGALTAVHDQNDQTIYVKLRFAKGPFVPFEPVEPEAGNNGESNSGDQ